MTKRTSNRFAPEVRQRAVRMVLEHGGDHASPWAAIGSIAAKIGCTALTLWKWVRQAERDGGQRSGATTEACWRIKALEREVRELRQANEILKKASAYVAMAEQRRRSKPSTATPSIRFRQEAGAPGTGRDRLHRRSQGQVRDPADLPFAGPDRRSLAGPDRCPWHRWCCRLPRRPTTLMSPQRVDPTRRSPRAHQDAALMVRIRQVHETNFGVDGVRKVWRQLGREGVAVARCTIALARSPKGTACGAG